MSKMPAIQFYPGDWRKDPGVQSLSFHDRGVWIEMLWLMHESPRRGYLLMPNGKPMSVESLARVIGLVNQISTTGLTMDATSAQETLGRLLENGVASRDESTGAIFNRRMVRDENIRLIRTEAGKRGGNPNLVKQIGYPKSNLGVNRRLLGVVNQNPTPSSSSSSSSSEDITPSAKSRPGKKNPTGPHPELIAHFTAAWAAKYGKPYPFEIAAGRNGNAIKGILTACGNSLADAMAVVDRFLACDDYFLHGHDLSMLQRQITKFMSEQPKGKNGQRSKTVPAGIHEDLTLG